MRDLVSYGNSYIMEKSQSSQPCNRAMLKNIASYITKIFDILGLISKPEEIGFATSENASVNVSVFSRQKHNIGFKKNIFRLRNS
jgi:hypothetical protein